MGGGKLSRISNIKILTKQFNPGTPVGQQFVVPYVDFLLNRTATGQISIDYLINTSSGITIQADVDPDTLLGTNVLFTQPEDDQTIQNQQQQIWHRYYIQTEAQFLQLLFFMSDSQMRTPSIARSDFELHAMLFYVSPQGRIIG